MYHVDRVFRSIDDATGKLREAIDNTYGFASVSEMDDWCKRISQSMYLWCDEHGRDPQDYPMYYSDGGNEGIAAKLILSKIGDYHTLIDLDAQQAAHFVYDNGVDPDVSEDFVCALFAEDMDGSRWI